MPNHPSHDPGSGPPAPWAAGSGVVFIDLSEAEVQAGWSLDWSPELESAPFVAPDADRSVRPTGRLYRWRLGRGR